MAKKLTATLNAVQSAPIEIQYLNGDLSIIQKLDDEPNDVGGLTSAELKERFDRAGNIIKEYINETLIPAILAADATEADRAAAESARADAETQRVQSEAQRVKNEQARQTAESARNDWGSYSSSKSYVKGNKVESGGDSYVCIVPCTGIAPPNTAYWQLIAAHGRDGENGKPGKDGQGAPSDDTPKAPGTASPGTASTFSRSDHVHPKQSVSKSDVGLGNVDNVKQQARITANGVLKGSGSGNVSAAVAGTDYMKTGNIVKQTLVATETTPTANYEINWYYK